MQKAIRISVLIPTLGRKKELIDTLLALRDQTVLPDEIVVVDQNVPSFPEVDELCSRFESVRHVRTPTPGVALNYNLALKHATSEVVLYLDDDIVPDRQLVERHLANYKKANSPGAMPLGGVAGRVLQPDGDPDPRTIGVFGRYHRWSGTITARFNATRESDVEISPGGNMSFYRDVLLNVGGFDLGFGGNGYFFETDGSLRVHRAGYRIVFDPKAELRHLMAPAGGARIRDKSVHTYHYTKNGIRLYRRHSPVLALPWLVSRSILYVMAKAAYNRDFRILFRGLKGIWDGVRQPMKVQGL